MRQQLIRQRPIRIACLWDAVFALICGATRTTLAKSVTVHVQSGRSFIGDVDPKSDQETLWMRFESAGRIKVLRPIKWSRVRGIETDNGPVDIDQFRASVADRAAPSTLVPDWPSTPCVASFDATSPTATAQAKRALGFTSRPVAIVASARLGQWDKDVQPDGIEVVVTALDDRGDPVEVSGTVSLEFIVPQAVDREQAPRQHGSRLTTVARSSHVVTSRDYRGAGAVLRMNFRQNRPFDRSYFTHGILHVRMTIPGHGVFRTSVEDMPHRTYSQVRELSERAHGERYLPQEK